MFGRTGGTDLAAMAAISASRGFSSGPWLGDDAENPRYIITEPRVGYRMARVTMRGRRRTTRNYRCLRSDRWPFLSLALRLILRRC